MVPKLENKKKGNKNLLYIGVAAVVLVLIIATVAGYMYLDAQDRQRKLDEKREGLKQAFSDQLNETGRQYALIGSYPAAPNKNYVEDYRLWIDGYQRLADNYTQAVSLLGAGGTEYQAMLADDNSEHNNVSWACSNASARARALNDTIAGFEADYDGRLGLKNDASAGYSLALEHSRSLYGAAWGLMQQNANYSAFGGYLKYLKACADNNTFYELSIGPVEEAGSVYQAYLRDSEYFGIETTVRDLRNNVTKLSSRYADLAKWKPNLTLVEMDINTAWSSDKGFYKAVNFLIDNNNRKNNVEPWRVWNVVVHYVLVDKVTGAVRSTADVSVTTRDYWRTDVHVAILPCEETREYDARYTITYEY